MSAQRRLCACSIAAALCLCYQLCSCSDTKEVAPCTFELSAKQTDDESLVTYFDVAGIMECARRCFLNPQCKSANWLLTSAPGLHLGRCRITGVAHNCTKDYYDPDFGVPLTANIRCIQCTPTAASTDDMGTSDVLQQSILELRDACGDDGVAEYVLCKDHLGCVLTADVMDGRLDCADGSDEDPVYLDQCQLNLHNCTSQAACRKVVGGTFECLGTTTTTTTTSLAPVTTMPSTLSFTAFDKTTDYKSDTLPTTTAAATTVTVQTTSVLSNKAFTFTVPPFWRPYTGFK